MVVYKKNKLIFFSLAMCIIAIFKKSEIKSNFSFK